MATKLPISVVMSVFNGEKYLGQSIESILNQSFESFEFVIINDNSSDNSLRIVEKYALRDKRIKIIKNQNNIGLTKSLNKGLSIAKGKYIARQDHDDVSMPNRFSEQVNFLDGNPGFSLCGTNYNYIDDKNDVIEKKSGYLPLDSEQIHLDLPKRNCFFHSSIMFRNEGYSYREKFIYAQDYDFYLNLLTAGKKMANLKDPLLLWRMNDESISFKKNHEQKLFAQAARKMLKLRMDGRNDLYDAFNPESCKGRVDDTVTMLAHKMKLFLQNSNFREAKELFDKNYSRMYNVSWFNKKAFALFVNFPGIYKLYRKLIYKDYK